MIFVTAAADGCTMVRRWQRANPARLHVVLKVFRGFRECGSQPQGWHQYAPQLPRSSQRGHFFVVSPGYHRSGIDGPGLPRDIERFRIDARAMVASQEPWQLVTSFNHWHEGSAVAAARRWASASGYGQYLDVLREEIANPPSAPVPPIAPPGPTPVVPFPTEPDTVVVMAAGDIACDPFDARFNSGAGTARGCRQRATSDLLMAHAPDAVLPLGDNQYEGAALEDFLLSYHPTWGRLRAVTRPAVGNHEYLTPGAAGYFDYFNGAGAATGPAGDRDLGYYSFDVGRWHLVALNSNCVRIRQGCRAGSAQEVWLRADLASHRDRCVLAYWHHPRFSSGGHGSYASMDAIWRALYEAGAEVVLTGHDHNYERFAPQNADGHADARHGIRQFVVGTGGRDAQPTARAVANSEVRNSTAFGVLKLTLGPDAYEWRFLPAGSRFSDAGSGACHPAPGSR